MKQKFSSGTKCECMCHGKAGILEYCGYCANSHRRVFQTRRQEDNHTYFLQVLLGRQSSYGVYNASQQRF